MEVYQNSKRGNSLIGIICPLNKLEFLLKGNWLTGLNIEFHYTQFNPHLNTTTIF